MGSHPVTNAESTTALSAPPVGSLRPHSALAAARLLEMMQERASSENLQRLTLLVAMLQSLLHYTTNGDVVRLALWDAEGRCADFIDPDVMAQMKEWFMTEAVVARSTNKMAF